MNSQTIDSIVAQTLALLDHYGFELKETNAIDLLAHWLERYQANWVRLAVIEALYRGRYKAISVEHILNMWEERQHPTYLFGHDFERLICRKLPRKLTAMSEARIKREQLTRRVKQNSREFNHGAEVPENNSLDSYQPESPPNPSNWQTTAEYSERLSDFEAIDNDINSTPDHFNEQESNDFEAEDWEEYAESTDEDVSDSSIPYRSDWLRGDNSQNPIGQFTPSTSESRFYQKLKSVAQKSD